MLVASMRHSTVRWHPRCRVPQPRRNNGTHSLTCSLTRAGAAALPGGRAARHAAAEQLPSQEPEAGEHGRGTAGTGRARVRGGTGLIHGQTVSI